MILCVWTWIIKLIIIKMLLSIEIVERELAAVAEQRKKEREQKVQERKKQLEAEGHATEAACTSAIIFKQD